MGGQVRWYLLHPAVVHFPLALLLVGGAARALSLWRRAPAWLEEATTWLLWVGTLSAWVAVGLGHVAEDAAPHVPLAWKMLEAHEEAAWWTAGSFTALSVAVYCLKRYAPPLQHARLGVVAAWALCLVMLTRTAYFGGELVFRYGMGVGDSSAEETADQ